MLVLRLLQQVNGVGLALYAVCAAWAVTLVMVTLPARAQDGCSPCPPPLMMLAQVSDVAPIDEKEYQQIYQDAAAKVLNETVDDTKFQDQGQGVKI